MTVENVQLGTREIYEILGDRNQALNLIADGYNHGRNLTNHLETLSPSEDRSREDCFDRLMEHAGIVVRSDPMAGYWASSAREFFDTPANRVLYTEFFARTWRRVAFARPQQRAIYLSSDGTPGSWERPYFDAQQARWDFQLAPAIPLSELVAMTLPIEGQDYRSFYLTYAAENLRTFRIGESGDVPIAKLADAERTIQLQKFGRGLQATYEQIRRMRVDKLAMQIALVAVQAEVDKVAAGLNILVNGDGNSGTSPTTHDLTTLDTDAVAGTLSLKGWLSFKLKFANPYMATTGLMQEAVALQLALLNAGSANVPLMGLNLGGMVQMLTPINMTSDGLRFGWTSDAPSLQIVAFDRRFAMDLLVEIGGKIDEMERFITNQTEIMTMTEVMGFAVNDGNATLILDVNA